MIVKYIILSVLAPLATSVSATPTRIFVATNPEMASGFKDLAECQKSIGVSPGVAKATDAGRQGTAFNRAHGNTSRCEIINGEALVVVYPAELADPQPKD